MAFNVSQGIGNITSGPVYVLQENILEQDPMGLLDQKTILK